jgi:hypothetical protein
MNLKLMFFRKPLSTFTAILSIVVVGLALFGGVGSSVINLPFLNTGPRHSLTGESGKDSQVIVIKIDDTTYAHPQVGLRSADVVYIEQVEGGLTRLAAVFSSKIPQIVGPVRSARISDIELLSQYGKVGFAYSGAQRLMLPVIASANLYDLGATHYGPKFYQNDPARIAPYAMMLKVPELLNESKIRGNTLSESSPMGWTFGDAPANLLDISKVHISWPASSYGAEWSEDENRWLLIHNGNVDVDDTGYRLGPKTIVIQIVSITDSIYHDKVGGVTPFSATVGSGRCYLLRDGGYVPCLWSRQSAESGTTFTDVAGNPVNFESGQIWFALTAKEPVFTPAQSQDATKSASK